MENRSGEKARTCPLCAEPVDARAILCPHCGGRQAGGFFAGAYRRRPGRQIAGVSVALAETLGVSVTLVRLAFIILTFINLLGPFLYVALWLLLPGEPGESTPLVRLSPAAPVREGGPSIFERWVEKARSLYRRTRDGLGPSSKESPRPDDGHGRAEEPTR